MLNNPQCFSLVYFAALMNETGIIIIVAMAINVL